MNVPEQQPQRFSIRYGRFTIHAESGDRLLDVILRAEPLHRHICGGHGFCTSCRVEVVRGSRNLSPVSTLECQRLGPEARSGKLRLACQTRVYGPAEVRVPTPKPARFAPDE